MALNLETILRAGLLMAFILPAMALVSSTLPSPVYSNQTGVINITKQFNATGALIFNQIGKSYANTSVTLIGSNCGPPPVNGIPGSQSLNNNPGKNCTGSFYSNPTIFQAFAFILSGIGTVLTDIVQLPYVDYESLQLMELGMYSVLPGFPLALVSVGIDGLYIYMALSMLLLGISAIQKYNFRVGAVIPFIPIIKLTTTLSYVNHQMLLSNPDIIYGIIIITAFIITGLVFLIISEIKKSKVI